MSGKAELAVITLLFTQKEDLPGVPALCISSPLFLLSLSLSSFYT